MSGVPLLDLKAQYATLREPIEAAVRRVIEDQAFILGPEVERLEAEVASYVGAGAAIGCASGTDALILALAGLGIGAGDTVLTSPFSFFATASCAYKVGARPRFVDIEPTTFNLDPARVEDALDARTRAILPVHLFGQCADLDPLLDLAERRGVAIVEDAAQALGASYASRRQGRERRAGAWGAAGCFSFFPSKNLGGFGDGGMIATSDPALAERLRLLRVHGGQQMYHHQWVGWNSRLDALQATVLRVKLPHLDAWSAGRQAHAERYRTWLAEAGLVGSGRVRLPGRLDASSHIYNQFTLRVERRDGLREHLRRKGIGQAVYYPVPLHLQECFRDLGYREGDFPHAERACREVLSLPVYPELREEQQEQVVAAIVEFYAQEQGGLAQGSSSSSSTAS